MRPVRAKATRRVLACRAWAGLLTMVLLAGAEAEAAAKPAGAKSALTSRTAFDLGVEAYVFGYPLVAMDLTRRLMCNVQEPAGLRAPMGQFARVRAFPPASNRDVTFPNADTLYAGVWLDVAREPWVLELPLAKERYTQFAMLDGWNTVFGVCGARTTGDEGQKYLLTGPEWKGKLPAGMKAYRSPTSIVWVLGRIHCTGTPEDYRTVYALQDQCRAVPLSSHGQPYTPPLGQIDPRLDVLKTVNEQISLLSVGAYFNQLALLMKENPPTRGDVPMIKKMARLGIVPGQAFDLGSLGPDVAQALQHVPQSALARIMGWFKEGARSGDWVSQDGWTWTLKTGAYGTDYTQRALVAATGLGANGPEDMVQATSTVDGAGQPYSGNFRYTMHFAPGQAPSANGFWSLTLYDSEGFLVSNPLGRHTLSSRDSFSFNPDNSLDFYIQKHPPGADREANWLPAPEGRFMLMLRFYWPKESLLKRAWKIPPVKRAD